MDNLIRNLSIIGYVNRSSAFSDISNVMGKPNNYLKRRRDEFDVLTNSTRRGQCNRPVLPAVQSIFDEFHTRTFAEMTQIVKNIIANQSSLDLTESSQDAVYLQEMNRFLTPNCGRKHILKAPVPLQNRTAIVRKVTWRDPVVAANALCNANYKCEICSAHPTFIRKSNGKPYTEPHHLVPMKAQKDFSVSLDVENNVVSLCSNCHNQIHYGNNVDEILGPLFSKREVLLATVGISIRYDDLKKYY